MHRVFFICIKLTTFKAFFTFLNSFIFTFVFIFPVIIRYASDNLIIIKLIIILIPLKRKCRD